MGHGLFDLEKHFAFYAAYHSHPVNILIHTLFVWPIFFTALLLGSFIPPIVELPVSAGSFPFQEYVVFNLSFIAAVVYALFYIMLDKKAGALAGVLCMLCWIGSNALGQKLGFSLGWKVALIAQLICWTSQFIGHGVFEKRAPALLDNLIQAFLMAPFFVLLEILQKFLGYEPYAGFRKAVTARVSANIKDWKVKKQKKFA
eukprot:TRINITY_DN638_c0_g1_i1.p1 TRINITY_DN638_c0_g1~~TRINITY_DN638_c0_g1_i1.p1  ORF type:complete len:201 (+),score=16.54 TRINITY_DN638_c0_g1_i1:358-960(+)